jgi:EGF-like domain
MCSRDYGIMNGYPECSGNGVCNNATSQCICHSGWTSRTDFLTDPYYDCDINILAIQILVGISLVCSIIALIIGTFNISSQLPITSKKLKDPKVAYTIWTIGGNIGVLIYTTAKIIDPAQNVLSPDSPAVIVGWVIYQLFWMWAAAYFGCILGLFIKNYTKLIPNPGGHGKLVENALFACANLSPVVSVPCLVFPVALALSPANHKDILSAFIYYVCFVILSVGFMIMIIAICFVRLIAKILKGKDEASHPQGLSIVYYLMFTATIIVGCGVFVIAPLHIPFGVMNSLRRKYIYLYLFLQNCWSAVSVFCLMSQMKRKSSIVAPIITSNRRASLNVEQHESLLARAKRKLSVLV